MAFIFHWAIRATAGAGGLSLFPFTKAVDYNRCYKSRDNNRDKNCTDII